MNKTIKFTIILSLTSLIALSSLLFLNTQNVSAQRISLLKDGFTKITDSNHIPRGGMNVTQAIHGKFVISNQFVYSSICYDDTLDNYLYSLYTFNGKKLIENAEYIYITDSNYVLVQTNKYLYVYDKNMSLVQKYKEDLRISDISYLLVKYESSQNTDTIYEDTPIPESDEFDNKMIKYDYDKADYIYSFDYKYCKEISAWEIDRIYSDSGLIAKKPFRYLDEHGDDVFENSFDITVEKYLGHGYFLYSKGDRNKVGIGLLSNYTKLPETTYVSKVKIKKVYKKKFSSKLLKLKVNKIKKATGYQVAIYKNAPGKKTKKPLLKKCFKNTTIKVKSKKLCKRKKLYIKVRAYKGVVNNKLYGEWSQTKRIKIKK